VALGNWTVGRTTGWTARRTATLKSRPTKKERKTKQKQQESKDNTKPRGGEKERQSLSLLLGKAAQGGRENPTKEVAEKDPRFFQSFDLSLNKREYEKRDPSISNVIWILESLNHRRVAS
jgi:hypothetical protein